MTSFIDAIRIDQYNKRRKTKTKRNNMYTTTTTWGDYPFTYIIINKKNQ